MKEAGPGDSGWAGAGPGQVGEPWSLSQPRCRDNEVGLPLILTEPPCPALYPANHNDN